MRTTWWSAFVKKSIENGIDIIRIFDALNDLRNLEHGRQGHQEVRRHVRNRHAATPISPVHNEEYFVKLAKEHREDGRGRHLHQGYGEPAAAL